MDKERTIKLIKNGVAIVVIISMMIIIFYQNRDRDLFKFGKNESSSIISPNQNSSGGYFPGDVQKSDDNIVYLNTTNLHIMDKDGEGDKIALPLSNPVLHTRGEFSVVYNRDALDVTVFKGVKKFYSVKCRDAILCAKVNHSGYVLLVTEKEGYTCECMVYNKRGEALFKWSISKSEFLDGDINDKNNTIVLSLAAAGKDKLSGEIVLLDITQAKQLRRKSFSSQLFYKVHYNSNGSFIALGNKSLRYFNTDGSEKWAYDYNNESLTKADVTNPDIIVLAFKKLGSGVKGNSTKVVVLNRLGKKIGSRSYDYIADDVSVGENSVALAFGKLICINDKSLKQKKRIMSESGVKKIALFNNDTHVFAISGSGGKILN